MSRDQLRETIEGPVQMAGAEICDELVDRLLNDIGDDPQLLPVLQHLLFRLWEQSATERERGLVIRLNHYGHESIRGMRKTLNLHAEAASTKLQGYTRRRGN